MRVIQLLSFLSRAMHCIKVELCSVSGESWIGDWCRNHAGELVSKPLPDLNGGTGGRGEFFIGLRGTKFRGCRGRGLARSVLFAS